MTTTENRPAVSADDTLARLRSGAPLTPTERDGLAALFDTVRSCLGFASRTEHDSDAARSGLLRNVLDRYAAEFGRAPFTPGAPVRWPTEDGERIRATVVTDDGLIAEIRSYDRGGTVLVDSRDLTADP